MAKVAVLHGLSCGLRRQLEGYDHIITNDGYKIQTLISEIIMSYPLLNQHFVE